MNAGDLRHKIVVKQREITVDENGKPHEDWVTFKEVFAKVKNLHGREFWEARAVNAETTVKFVVRFIVGLLPDMRIEFGGKFYEIIAIDDIEYKKRWMEIKGKVIE